GGSRLRPGVLHGTMPERLPPTSAFGIVDPTPRSIQRSTVTQSSSTESAPIMTPERLAEFGAAWNQHDADLLMTYMADECSYQASFGPDLEGSNYEGRDAVRDGYARFFAHYPDGIFGDSRVFVAGDRGASEWTFTATAPDGARTSVRGCDLFEFDGNKIRRKDAFRKQRTT
ncbi:MAG: nuclear transport factor 2 family protein, partial [Thermomicrobiales bacterium]